ncbi:MAG: transposase, partial [Candidatus Marinimicrobia bacterium]|nr:transposase [Candidatus Neomarinimicrobiota bacterium]
MVTELIRRQYTAEFKREAVELLLRSGKTARALADDLGIRSDLLGKWKSQYL